ncbi:MAG: hypothetical protein JST91_23060 [Actinobacteria bacterium]|nr:hypothetical protein [Actinomycetota bacterium]
MSTPNDAIDGIDDDYDGYDEEDRVEDQIPQEDSLLDRGVDDLLDEGYSPPDRPYARDRYDEHETLDELLAAEEPDISLDDPDDPESEFPEDAEIGRRRAGRLVAAGGDLTDNEDELLAWDVGIDGGAASAEEAAIHVIDDDE